VSAVQCVRNWIYTCISHQVTLKNPQISSPCLPLAINTHPNQGTGALELQVLLLSHLAQSRFPLPWGMNFLFSLSVKLCYHLAVCVSLSNSLSGMLRTCDLLDRSLLRSPLVIFLVSQPDGEAPPHNAISVPAFMGTFHLHFPYLAWSPGSSF
jgi:hypothetical protein